MLVIIIAYIAGAIPGGYLLNRYLPGFHIPVLEKYLNMFHYSTLAANVSSPLYSMLADGVKGVSVLLLVPFLARLLDGSQWHWLVYPFVSNGLVQAAALVAAVCGHVFAVYVCGWGGKGTAVMLGGFFILAPTATIIALLIFVPVALFTHTVLFGSLTAACSMPLLLWFTNPDDVPLQLCALFLAVLSVLTHYRDIQLRHAVT